VPAWAETFAGEELEGYLRVLQSLEAVPLYPWSVRAFSPADVARLSPVDSVHPWADRFDFSPGPEGMRVEWIRPRAELVYNSAFPYGSNDGPVWAGRGLTSSVRGGVAVRYGPLSLSLAPELFWTENAAFDLYPNGSDGPLSYGAWRYAEYIDLPQRFGEGAYARVDPGQSTLRLDLAPVTLGVSTANEYWGPASQHPILLGNNAPGFPHVFVGTGSPADLWVGRLHGRVVWGRLEQSEYAPPMETDGKRMMSGLVLAFSPRGMDGLEVGLGRFFHSGWPEDGIGTGDLALPFEGFFKTGLLEELGSDEDRNAANQIASVFARWVLPKSGFELYGEFGREDHSWDVRQFMLQPDDISAYMLGFRKAWRRSDGRIVVLRGETINSAISHLVRTDRNRTQSPMYIHYYQRQGHTNRGQLLGSPAGFGEGGSLLGADLYHRGGRWSVVWESTERASVRSFYWDPVKPERGPDVIHSVKVESLLFGGRYDVTAGLTGIYNLNRNFAEDVFGVRLELAGHAAVR